MAEPMAEPTGSETTTTTTEAAAAASSLLAGLDQTTLLLSAVLPLLLIVFFFLRPGKGGKSGRSVLIFGPVGGGKTALFNQIRYGRTIPSVSSMEPASGSFAPRGGEATTRQVHAIDMPGTGRLRARLLEEAAGAAALVCVLDGTQLVAQARDAAQQLFDVLSHETVARRRPPLLVVVNKSDVGGSCATPAAARKALEQEVPRIRLARTTMEDTSDRSKPPKGSIAEDHEGAFSFDQLGSPVQFAATSATKPDVAALIAFALKHAR